MVVYKVSSGAVPLASDINQVYDTFSGLADAGKLSMAASVPAPAAPTATVAAGTGLGVGDYYYGVSFITGYLKSDGTYAITGETLTKSIGAKVTTTTGNQKVNLKLPIGPSNAPHVIGRRVYRSKVGTISPMYLAAEILNDTQVDYADTKPDTGLNTAVKENTTDTTGTRFTQLICDELVVGRPRLKTNANVIYTAELYGGSDKPYIMRWDGGTQGGGSDMGIGYQSTASPRPRISIFNASDAAVIDFLQDGSIVPSGGINIKGTLDGAIALTFPAAGSIYYDQYGNIVTPTNLTDPGLTWSMKDADGRVRVLMGLAKGSAGMGNQFKAFGGANEFFHENRQIISVYGVGTVNSIIKFNNEAMLKYQSNARRFEVKDANDAAWGDFAAGTVTVVNLVTTSSRDYKKDITDYEASALDLICKTKVRNYRFNEQDETDPLSIGLIVEESPADIVAPGGKGINTYAVDVLEWKGIQELVEIAKALTVRVTSLEAEVSQLKGKA